MFLKFFICFIEILICRFGDGDCREGWYLVGILI